MLNTQRRCEIRLRTAEACNQTCISPDVFAKLLLVLTSSVSILFTAKGVQYIGQWTYKVPWSSSRPAGCSNACLCTRSIPCVVDLTSFIVAFWRNRENPQNALAAPESQLLHHSTGTGQRISKDLTNVLSQTLGAVLWTSVHPYNNQCAVQKRFTNWQDLTAHYCVYCSNGMKETQNC